jgi:hypothetical protein
VTAVDPSHVDVCLNYARRAERDARNYDRRAAHFAAIDPDAYADLIAWRRDDARFHRRWARFWRRWARTGRQPRVPVE